MLDLHSSRFTRLIASSFMEAALTTYIDVNAYHPTGNYGVSATDDTICFTNAVGAAVTSGQKLFLFPSGKTFLLNPGVISNFPNGSVLLCASCTFKLAAPQNNTQMISFDNIDGIKFCDAVFDGGPSWYQNVTTATFTAGSANLTGVANTSGIVAGQKIYGYMNSQGIVQSVSGSTVTMSAGFSVPASGSAKPILFSQNTNSALVGAFNASNVIFENCIWKNIYLMGTGYTNVVNLTIDKCTFYSKQATNTFLAAIVASSQNGISSNDHCKNLKIIATRFENIGIGQIDVEDTELIGVTQQGSRYGAGVCVSATQNSKRFKISGGSFQNNLGIDSDDTIQNGAEIWASDASVMGGVFQRNGASGVALGGQGGRIVGNTFKNNGQTVSLPGLDVIYQTSTYNGGGAIIDANRFIDDQGAHTQSCPFKIAANMSSPVQIGHANIFSGNLTNQPLYVGAGNQKGLLYSGSVHVAALAPLAAFGRIVNTAAYPPLLEPSYKVSVSINRHLSDGLDVYGYIIPGTVNLATRNISNSAFAYDNNGGAGYDFSYQVTA